MKVFLFLKDKATTKEGEGRTHYENSGSEDEHSEVKTYKIPSMKNVEICNPSHSSYIYIIHDLKVSNCKSQQVESASLYCNNAMKLKDMHFDKVSKDKDKLELLKDEFVIILPGGKLGVEFNEELKDINGEIKIEKKRL